MPLTPILTAHWDDEDSHTIEGYRRHGGYDMVPVSFGVHPDEVIARIHAESRAVQRSRRLACEVCRCRCQRKCGRLSARDFLSEART